MAQKHRLIQKDSLTNTKEAKKNKNKNETHEERYKQQPSRKKRDRKLTKLQAKSRVKQLKWPKVCSKSFN